MGAALCYWLLRKKSQVVCVDDFRTGGRKNIADFEKEKNFHLLEHDLNQPLPKIEKIDYIFHLAGLEEYLDGKDVSLETLQVNSLGTQNLLELARLNKAKFLFASSLAIFSDFPLLTKINKGISDQQKSFSHHEAKRFSEALIAEYWRQYNLNCRIVRLVDIYGPGMNLEVGTNLAKLIKLGQEGGSLAIEAEKGESLYPTFVDDAVEGIARATFLSQTAGKIYNLVGPKTTLLKFTQEIRRLSEKDMEVVFKKREKEDLRFLFPPDFQKAQEELGWKAEISLEEGLKRTLTPFQKEETSQIEEVESKKKEVLPEKDLIEEKRRLPSFGRVLKIFMAFLLLAMAFLFPFLSLSWDIFWGFENLTFFEKEKISLTPSLVRAKSEEAGRHFLAGQQKIKDLNWLFKLVNQEEKEKEWGEKLARGEEIASGTKELAKTGQVLEKLVANILAGEEVKEQELKEGKISLTKAFEKWGEAESKLKESSSPEEQGWAKKLASYRQILKEGENWFDLFPQLVAVGGRRTYLLLLQNNMEIRPTGGFIGSFGLLTFENGKMMDLEIEDIYTADGQLRGHVEPPEPIKKYLGKEHWFLRDVNWDPDFPQTAAKAQWFLEKELGVKTDGVIAFDLNLIQGLLEVLGPLKVSDYQETVSAQDMFAKTQKYVQEDFFPGSTQKRDFLGALTQALVGEAEKEKKKWFSLGKTSFQALKEKHLLIYFAEPNLEEIILQNDWGGEIKALSCRGVPDCLGDYLMTVEANLGVNKVNYWVKKEVGQKITFDEEGKVTHELRLRYQNSSSPDDWVGGTYKNYLRIYLPPGLRLDDFEIQGIAASSATSATESARLTTESGKTTLGFYLEIPPESEKEVVITYPLAQKLSAQKNWYQLLLQKQAGSQNEPLTVEVFYPPSWQIKPVDNSFLTREGYLKYNGDLRTDQEFRIGFLK